MQLILILPPLLFFQAEGVCEIHTVPIELSNLERTRVIGDASVAFRKSVILRLWGWKGPNTDAMKGAS